MTPDDLASDIGIGATSEFSLRVSVATLVKVLLEIPEDRRQMLALERKATVLEEKSGSTVEVIAQPFGGAIRIRDPRRLREGIGDFRFDSQESRSEQDFRIFIRPSDWERARGFCIEQLTVPEDAILESDPGRELTEEFAEALKAKLRPDQYAYRPVGTVIEDRPAPTRNIHARGHPTVRVYRVFEAQILDPFLWHAMLANSGSYSSDDLYRLALKDARNGGKGRANAVLTVPMERIRDVYQGMSPEARNFPFSFEGSRLDESVGTLFQGVDIPRYRRL